MQAAVLLPDLGKLASPPPLKAEAVGAPFKKRLHIADRNTKLRFLIDTDSAVLLVPRFIFKRDLPRGPLTLSVANSSAIGTYSTHPMDLDLQLAKPLTWIFINADDSNPIIGPNFLAHFGLAVDLQNRKLFDADHIHHAVGMVLPTQVHSVAVNISADVAEGAFADLLHEFQDLATPGSTTISLATLSITLRPLDRPQKRALDVFWESTW